MSEGSIPIARSSNCGNDFLLYTTPQIGWGLSYPPPLKTKAGRIYRIDVFVYNLGSAPYYMMVLDKKIPLVGGEEPKYTGLITANELFQKTFDFTGIGGLYCATGITAIVSKDPYVAAPFANDGYWMYVEYK